MEEKDLMFVTVILKNGISITGSPSELLTKEELESALLTKPEIELRSCVCLQPSIGEGGRLLMSIVPIFAGNLLDTMAKIRSSEIVAWSFLSKEIHNGLKEILFPSKIIRPTGPMPNLRVNGK